MDDSILSTPPPFASEAMTIATRRWGLLPMMDWCKVQLSLGEDENLLVLVTLFVPFLIDVSLITAALPLAFLLYSLLAQFKGRAFWHGCLVYLESVLIAQYTFQVLRCAASSDASSEWYYAMIGFHFSPVKDLPLFVSYLSALFHTYRLSQVKSPPIQRTDQRAKAILASILPLDATSFWARLVKLACFEAVKFILRVIKAFREIFRVYRLVSVPHELSPQWIKVEISWPHSPMKRQARLQAQPSRHRQTASLGSLSFAQTEITEMTGEEDLIQQGPALLSQDLEAPSLRSSADRESEALILVESALRLSPLPGPREWLFISKVQHPLISLSLFFSSHTLPSLSQRCSI